MRYYIKELEPDIKLGKIRVSSHSDADGVYSTSLLATIFPIEEVVFPDVFGEVLDEDVVLDQVPIKPSYSGIVIDHHPQHLERRKYTLVLGDSPTSVVVYDLFKDKIKKEDLWKVIGGAVGDGQGETIPGEIWDMYPELLERYCYTREYYGELKISSIPLYMLLSSPINSACRVGQPYIAYKILKNATSYWNVLEDPALVAARKRTDEERKKMLSDTHPIDLGKVIVWKISSDVKIESGLARELEEKERKTVVVVNEKTGKISIRGILALYLKEKMPQYYIGGHPGFTGGSLSKDQKVEDLIKDLRKLF